MIHLAISPGIDATALADDDFGWVLLAIFGGLILGLVFMMFAAKDLENPSLKVQIGGLLVAFTPMMIFTLVSPAPKDVDAQNKTAALAVYPDFPINDDSLFCLSLLAGDDERGKPCQVSKKATAASVTTLNLAKVDGRVVLTKTVDPVVDSEAS